MDGSDDYFQDSFVLDEDDLAFLAAEEEKYAHSVSDKANMKTLPHPKRQKVSHSPFSEEPEIVLQADGTYGVTPVSASNEKNVETLKDAEPLGGDPGQSDAHKGRIVQIAAAWCNVNILLVPSLARVTRSGVLPNSSGTQTSKLQQLQRVETLHSVRAVPKRLPLQRTTEVLDSLSGQNLHPSKSAGPKGNGRPEDAMTTTDPQADARLQEQIAALKAQLDNLNREHNEAKVALKEAEVIRFAKEGEVTILRKRVEKAAQQHAADLVRLRETKETAEAEQARVQKDMKEQMERLRTEYIFKQHEVEPTNRNTSWSSRSKRIATGPQPSPIPLPPAMRNWASPNTAGPSRSYLPKENLSQKRAGLRDMSPKIPTKTRLEPKFPGFENSFLGSSPVKSPSRGRRPSTNHELPETRTPQKGVNGKGTAKGQGTIGVFSPVKMPQLNWQQDSRQTQNGPPADDFIQDFDADTGMSFGSPCSRSKVIREGSSPNPDQGDYSSVVDMDLVEEPDGDALLKDEDFQDIDWSEELHYMLFSHTCKVSETLTFHYLLSVSMPLNQDYQRACSSILEVLGAKYRFTSIEKLMDRIAEGFISMSNILWKAALFKHLRALFDLLSSTIIHIPAFTSSILRTTLGHGDEFLPFLNVLSSIALKSLEIKEHKDTEGDGDSLLIHSMLNLVETIVWTVPEHLSSCLSTMLRTDGVMLTLLDNRQPNGIISHAIQTLVLLATHSSLHPSLTSVPNLDLDGRLVKATSVDSSKIPVLEKLCGFFVDAGPLDSKGQDKDISSILNFFALLAVACPEGRFTLLKSNTLVPCLVYYLSRLTNLIWEDDERVTMSFDVAASTVQNIKQTLYLLHRLIFHSPTSDGIEGQNNLNFDFRQKLFHAPHSLFNGLAHMFIVMIGRLSYADPPGWLESGLQAEIEQVTEPARDLMDLVIEGPESDSVWAAYQDTGSESITEDDDEMEARLLDMNEPN
ncbi:hypothetical protein M0805_006361 [Coniferiporia weirii]|nr:hypothetical protein M0805_006361 [Coniferiporia weirii]